MSPKEIRINILKISQEKLAKKLGITKGALSNKENGKRKYTAKEIIEISKIARIKPSQIEL